MVAYKRMQRVENLPNHGKTVGGGVTALDVGVGLEVVLNLSHKTFNGIVIEMLKLHQFSIQLVVYDGWISTATITFQTTQMSDAADTSP